MINFITQRIRYFRYTSNVGTDNQNWFSYFLFAALLHNSAHFAVLLYEHCRRSSCDLPPPLNISILFYDFSPPEFVSFFRCVHKITPCCSLLLHQKLLRIFFLRLDGLFSSNQMPFNRMGICSFFFSFHFESLCACCCYLCRLVYIGENKLSVRCSIFVGTNLVCGDWDELREQQCWATPHPRNRGKELAMGERGEMERERVKWNEMKLKWKSIT